MMGVSPPPAAPGDPILGGVGWVRGTAEMEAASRCLGAGPYPPSRPPHLRLGLAPWRASAWCQAPGGGCTPRRQREATGVGGVPGPTFLRSQHPPQAPREHVRGPRAERGPGEKSQGRAGAVAAAAAAVEPLVPSLRGEQLPPPPPPSARGPRPERAGRAVRGGGRGRGGGWAQGREGAGGGSRAPGDQSPRERPWRRRRLTLGASCRAPGRHVRGWRGRAGRRRGGGRGGGWARGATPAAPRAAACAPAELPLRRRRRGLGCLRTGDGGGGGGHSRGTGRRRLGPDRGEEGATALRSAGQETGETRSVLRLQGTRSARGPPEEQRPGPQDPHPLPFPPPPPASRLGPLHRGSAAVARAQLAASRTRVLSGGRIDLRDGEPFLPSLWKELPLRSRSWAALGLCCSVGARRRRLPGSGAGLTVRRAP